MRRKNRVGLIGRAGIRGLAFGQRSVANSISGFELPHRCVHTSIISKCHFEMTLRARCIAGHVRQKPVVARATEKKLLALNVHLA